MGKNLMPEVAALLGVEIGEEFIIENADRKENVVLAMDGFHVIQPNGALDPDCCRLLSKVLQGLYEVEKLPWEPKLNEYYYCPSVRQIGVSYVKWWGDIIDYALKALGMVYRTKEEAEAHMAEDYERLTGNKLEEQAIVKIPWEPKRGESYYAMSIVGCAQPKIACYDWNGSAADYECLKNGLVHKTQAEAEEHFAEDYERLTGKKPEG